MSIPSSPVRASSQASTHLEGHFLTIARVAWIVVTVLVIGLFAAGLPVKYEQLNTPCPAVPCTSEQLPRGTVQELEERGLSITHYAVFNVAGDVIFASVWLAVAALIFWRRSSDRAALVVSFFLVTFGVGTFTGTLNALADVQPALEPVVRGIETLGVSFLAAALFMFPDGRFVPRWTGFLVFAFILPLILGLFFPGSSLNQETWGAALWTAVYGLLFAVVVATQAYRYRRVSGPVERQQTKWAVFGTAAALAGFVALISFETIFPALQTTGTLANIAVNSVAYVIMLFIPLSFGVAILRSRLWDIDFIINRALVYSGLTAIIVGLYVLVVGGLGALLHSRGGLLLSLLGAGLVAVLFAPLRHRLQRVANRLMYGERDDPYAVVSRLGRRLEATLEPEAVLPAVVESIARALRLPGAEIWLVDGETLRSGASHGEVPEETSVRDARAAEKLRRTPEGLRPAELGPGSEYGAVLEERGIGLVLPLAHRGELVGALCLAPRGPGEEFSAADRQLLRDLAPQAGAAADAVRLTVALRSSLEDLRHSRERLVAAQEEERRRIQRDLHDGLGPVLASMRLRLEACLDAEQDTDPSLNRDLERLYELVGQATGDIRRLVYDLRPPVLDQLGLVPALRQHCERFSRETGIEVRFETGGDLPIPAAAEVALLRVVQEALVNVDKHAQASQVDVRLDRRESYLTLTVQDDGAGFSTNGYNEGTGIGSMRERAELLGGTLQLDDQTGTGTELTIRIPIER